MTGAAARIRPATPVDADAIAALHADSWQRTYRGMLSEAYLDRPASLDLLALAVAP